MSFGRYGFAAILIGAVLGMSGCGSDSPEADTKPDSSDANADKESSETEATYSGTAPTKCLDAEAAGGAIGFKVALLQDKPSGGSITCVYLSLQGKRTIQVLAANAKSLDEAQSTYDNLASGAQAQIPDTKDAGIGAQSAVFSQAARLVLVARADDGTLVNAVLTAENAPRYQGGLAKLAAANLDLY